MSKLKASIISLFFILFAGCKTNTDSIRKVNLYEFPLSYQYIVAIKKEELFKEGEKSKIKISDDVSRQRLNRILDTLEVIEFRNPERIDHRVLCLINYKGGKTEELIITGNGAIFYRDEFYAESPALLDFFKIEPM